MQITSANIGDVIRLDHNSHHIRIEAVTPEFVHYRRENGEQYATQDHEIAGVIVQDKELHQRFAYHAVLGAALERAEHSALKKQLRRPDSPEEQREASSVRRMAQEMRHRLDKQITLQSAQQIGGHSSRSSLADMISKASAEAHEKPHTVAPERPFRKDR